ncbi:hypothetical protein PISL3812_01222 [Talaromyces islandicus]|uniref:Rhodopsin domain-containing protein n=1 Tax=Talaromyces islandicus TaxID=28573 RepID=A0A0U1LN81_TALIS|nr:hypothetical protein PISL3812_01222 [Talaromyces islandicus]
MPQVKDGVEDVSRAYVLYIITTIFTAATFITTTARIGTKLKCKLRLGIDDWLIMLGAALNIVADGFDYKATASGFGRHSVFLSEADLIEAAKYSQLAVGVANWSIGVVKLSVCFFLLNLIRGTHKRFRWAIYGMIALTFSFTLIGAILWGTQARPLAKLWDPRIPGTRGSTEDFLIVVYIVYAFGCFTDVFYALSPVYFLWSVQLEWKKKLPILLLTGCGILVVVVAVLNIIFARDFLDQEDSTWALTNEFICDIIERNFSTVVANLPALWLLVVRLRRKYTTYQKESSNNRSGYLPPRLAMSQRSMVISGTGKAQVSSQALDSHEMTEFSDNSHLLRSMPQYPAAAAAAHRIHVQTDVEVQDEPRNGPIPDGARLNV